MISDKFRKLLNSESKLKEAKKICENAGYIVTESSEILVGEAYYNSDADDYFWEISWESKDGWCLEYRSDVDWDYSEEIKDHDGDWCNAFFAEEAITVSGIDDDGKKFEDDIDYGCLEHFGPVCVCYTRTIPATWEQPEEYEENVCNYSGSQYDPSYLEIILEKFYKKYDYPIFVRNNKLYAKSEEELKELIKILHDNLQDYL